jgi:hypothetical protein
VGDLKEAIKMKNPSTMKCNAHKLQLYLAKMGDAWITNNEADGVSDVAGLPHLRFPQAKLRCVGLSENEMVEVDEDEEAAGNGLVNVLVVVPPEDVVIPLSVLYLPRCQLLIWAPSVLFSIFLFLVWMTETNSIVLLTLWEILAAHLL